MKTKTIIISGITCCFFAISCVNGSPIKEVNVSEPHKNKPLVVENNTKTALNVDHSAFDKLLKANVNDKGFVNYANFLKNKSALQSYLKYLSSVKLSNLSKNEKLAFWINAYNAATIDQIVRNYPVSSILKISDGKVWDQTLVYKFDNKSVTLNDIEKKILLGTELFDARIHFAVNCAAVSCPTLVNKAYTGNNVQDLLLANTKASLSDAKFNKITSNSASLSKLFDWYKADFIKAEGSIAEFINKYSATKISKNTKISYLDYNWDLNGK